MTIMNKKLLPFTLFLFIFSITYGQKINKDSKENSFSVFAESPLPYFSMGSYKYSVATLNLEYTFNRNSNRMTSLFLGYGLTYNITISNVRFDAVSGGILWNFGEKWYRLEVGGGLSYFGFDMNINGRIGARLIPGNRILIRVAYTPYVFTGLFTSDSIIESFENFLSVSFGYRFGIHSKRKKEDKL